MSRVFVRFARSGLFGLVLCCLFLQISHAAQVAWLRDGQVQIRQLSKQQSLLTAESKVPLGSVWKLFVYAYLVENKISVENYACGQKSPVDEERYCCHVAGEQVTQDTALARSCAPFFAWTRLGVTAAQWRKFWLARGADDWLLAQSNLQPDMQVSLSSLLRMLQQLPAQSIARHALLDVALSGYGRDAWADMGTGIRYKTYSWHDTAGRNIGGAVGWLADGTPFWFGALGASRSALNRWASAMAAVLPMPRFELAEGFKENSCVDVDFFSSYPLRAVYQADKTVGMGRLRGEYRLQFSNGNWLTIVADGDMRLTEKLTIQGRFSLNQYVARVVDREGSGQPEHAARALAIAARSYLLQNAHFEAGCWHIADASNKQRVSPNPATADALAAAWFTDDLLLSGVDVRYHQTSAGQNRLAWQSAVQQAKQGDSFIRILSNSYPKANIEGIHARLECQRLPAAEQWLVQNSQKWLRQLQRLDGFEPLENEPQICQLSHGVPYADLQRERVYVRGWTSLNDRITLAHEYLHLAFRFHPNGADEAWVEQLARRLVEGRL